MTIEKTQTLAPGTELVGRYKRTQFTATVREDGIYVEPAPLTPATAADPHGPFKSLSAAAKAVMGGISANGWRFWSLAGSEPSTRPVPEKANAASARSLVQIKKRRKQDGCPDGEVAYFCSACMEGFCVPCGETPDVCPQGHPREVVDDFAGVPATSD